MSQVKSGLRLAALILLFLLVAGLFFAGVLYAFFPAGHSRVLGWVFLIISTTVMVVEMNRWAKTLPGILGMAVLNGLITLWTGHLLANPSNPMSRLDALIMTLFFLASTHLSRTFTGRKLNLVDRIAVLAFVFIFALLLAYGSTTVRSVGRVGSLRPLDFIGMGVGLCCLLIAWAYHRFQRRRGPKHRSESSPEAIRLGSD